MQQQLAHPPALCTCSRVLHTLKLGENSVLRLPIFRLIVAS